MWFKYIKTGQFKQSNSSGALWQRSHVAQIWPAGGDAAL